MRTATVLSARDRFSDEFARCCREYKSLEIAVAWCGDPEQTLPYKHFDDFKGKIVATVGCSFNQTHPDAIQWLLDKPCVTRIFHKEKGLFHPKLYLFSDGDRYAVFVGSSNLTYAGFYENVEANVLIEGVLSENATDVRELQQLLAKWRGDEFSFTPSKPWLKSYREDHRRYRLLQRKYGIKTQAFEEESFGPNWLQKADWKIYYQKVIDGMKQNRRDIKSFHHVLDAASQLLSVPWKTSYFIDPERRRIIGGVKPYGAMGHVFAAGTFAHLVKSRKRSWGTFVSAVNHIAMLEPPVVWNELESHLRRLVRLGNTMKVWGRVLALIRPDLYCSVSSSPLRTQIAKTLKVPSGLFEEVEGYTRLIKLLHSSPWFNSPKPLRSAEAEVWKRRAAFMDGIFWVRKGG
jgi:HKD family nuclease